LIGSGLDTAAAQLAEHGASTVYQIDAAAYASYASESYTEAIAKLARERDAGVVLFADTSFGKDLAPVAVRLGAGSRPTVVSIEAGPTAACSSCIRSPAS
jgi:electron transfer flavoprotein alpha subunit